MLALTTILHSVVILSGKLSLQPFSQQLEAAGILIFVPSFLRVMALFYPT